MPLESELHRLAALLRLRRIDRSSYRRALGELLRQQLRCDAVSLWRLDGVESRYRLRLVGRQAAPDPLCWPQPRCDSWQQHEAPLLLQRLLDEGSYRCADTLRDAALDGLQPQWLQPQGLRALMLVPLRLNGRLRSLLCCEQLSPRAWSLAELARLKRFASAAGLQLGQLERLEQLCPEAALWPALA
jgi:GAF domain-containing protein